MSDAARGPGLGDGGVREVPSAGHAPLTSPGPVGVPSGESETREGSGGPLPAPSSPGGQYDFGGGGRSAAVQDLERVIVAAKGVLAGAAVLSWLGAPNVWLGGCRPLDLIAKNRTDEVLAALEAIADGVTA